MKFFEYLKNRAAGKEIITNSTGNSQGLKLSFGQFTRSGGLTQVGEVPDIPIRKVRDLVKNDSIVKGAIKKTVAKALQNGYHLRGRNERSGEKKLRNLINNGWNYDEHLEQVVTNLALYQNCFVEVLDEDTINLLETTYTQPMTDEFGNVVGYKQTVKSSTQRNLGSTDYPKWAVDEVVHYKMNHFDTNEWSDIDIRAAAKWIYIKRAVQEWIHFVFDKNLVRPTVRVGRETSQKALESIKNSLKELMESPKKPIGFKGDATIGVFFSYAEEAESIHELINLCNSEILTTLQVPPGVFGLGGDKTSGRTDPAEQRNQFNDYVKSIRRTVKVYEEQELFPKIGAPATELHFGIVDMTETRQVFENVRTMRQAQFSNDAIKEYLIDNGVFFDTEEVLKSDEEIAEMSNKELGTGNEGIKGNVSADEAESRERQVEDDASRASMEQQREE